MADQRQTAQTRAAVSSDSAGADSAVVRRELDRLLSSSSFDASARNRRFLSYIVEETLAGRGNRIKAYSIATSVFGRSDSFDPLHDSIVRIEAGRLRRAIEHYYLTEGQAAPLRIRIPKGTYEPAFETAPLSPAPAAPLGAHLQAPRIMVRPVEQQSWSPDCPDISRTLTLQIIAALTKFTEIFVYAFDTTVAGDTEKGARHLAMDYELVGTVALTQSSLRADFLLRHSRDGRYVWSLSVSRSTEGQVDPAGLAMLCSDIAGGIASTLAQRDGVMDSQARESGGDVPRQFSSQLKLVEFQDYWRTLDLTRFQTLRRAFEEAIRDDPHFAAGYACLSHLYSDAARYGIDCGPQHPRPLDHALQLANEAVRLAPNSGRAHGARGVAEWFLGQSEKSLETLRLAHALNPNDPELMAELGFRSAMRMQWDIAVPLLLASYQRNPLQSVQYHMGLFFYHMATGDYGQALQEALLTKTPQIAYPHIACAAAFAAMGRKAEAHAHLLKAHELAPTLLPRLREDLAFRQIHPDLVETIAGAVETVGFVAPTAVMPVKAAI